MRQNKKTFLVLLILVFGIWGMIAYRILTSLPENEENKVHSVNNQIMERSIEHYSYINNVRDPFSFVRYIKKDTIRKSNIGKITKTWNPPPFKLIGILSSGKRKTATIEGKDGCVYFLCEGDTLSGIKILKINSGEVFYAYSNRRCEWILQN